MKARPARRAVHAVRSRVLGARRVLARADAIQDARRALAVSDVERPLVRPRDIAQHLDDAALVVGSSSNEQGRVVVGKFASIAHGVEFAAQEPDRSELVAQFPLRARLVPGDSDDAGDETIHVGDDVWIAEGALVMSGVRIGPGAFVATRAVVTSDVAPYAIVSGVPAKQIGRRFDDDQIAALLRIAWWDWPIETIKERVDLLSSPDIDAFIAAFDPGPPPPSDGDPTR